MHRVERVKSSVSDCAPLELPGFGHREAPGVSGGRIDEEAPVGGIVISSEVMKILCLGRALLDSSNNVSPNGACSPTTAEINAVLRTRGACPEVSQTNKFF